MAEYRIFRVNSGGLIDSGQRLGFADEATALAYARDLNESRVVEVWSGNRRVGIVPPRSPARSA